MDGTQSELDEVDRGILHLLQRDARNNSIREIKNAVGVSAGTVRDRIEELEDAGVLCGYLPDVDYERAGYRFTVLFTCTATEPSRALTEEILDRRGVVAVRTLLADQENYHVEVVGADTTDISNAADELRECGLTIVRSAVLDDASVQPFDHFENDVAREDDR